MFSFSHDKRNVKHNCTEVPFLPYQIVKMTTFTNILLVKLWKNRHSHSDENANWYNHMEENLAVYKKITFLSFFYWQPASRNLVDTRTHMRTYIQLGIICNCKTLKNKHLKCSYIDDSLKKWFTYSMVYYADIKKKNKGDLYELM